MLKGKSQDQRPAPTLDEELADLARRSLLQRLLDGLFGYDFFISYRWEDGRAYAVNLASELKERGFDCFLDSESYAKGQNWKTVGALAIRRTSRLILVGSPDVLKSQPVLREIQIFSRSGRTIIPIDFGGTLSPPLLEGHPLGEYVTPDLLQIDEEISRLPKGPSENTLRELQKVFNCERQSARRIRALKVACLGLLLLAVFAFSVALVSFQAKQTADRLAGEKQAELNKATQSASLDLEWKNSEAASKQIAAKALGILADDPKLAALLALEAVKIAPTREAERVLRQTLLEPFPPLVLRGHTNEVYSVRFSSDGKQVLTTGRDGTVRLWDATMGSNVRTLCPTEGRRSGNIVLGQLSSDGSKILTMRVPSSFAIGSWTNTTPIQLFDVASGKSLVTIWDGFAVHAALSPNNNQIVTAGFNTKVKIWDARTGSVQFDLGGYDEGGHQQRVTSAAFSSNGKWIVTGSYDGTARIWEASSGRTLKVLPINKPLNWASFSPDDTAILLLAGETTNTINNRHVYVWGWAGTGHRELTGHESTIIDGAFSSDGKLLATASTDQTARLWDVATGKCLQVLLGHEDVLYGIDLSANGEWLVTLSADGSARIWEVSTGESMALLGDKVHRDEYGWPVPRTCCAFSSDGKRIVTGAMNGDVEIYTCDYLGSTKDLLALARSRVTRRFTAKERQDYGLDRVVKGEL